MATKKEDGPIRHKLNLYRGTVEMLKEVLKSPMWYKDKPEHLADACLLRESVVLTSQTPPKMEEKAADYLKNDAEKLRFMELREGWEKDVLEPWLGEQVEFEVSEGERDAMKACVDWYRKEGRLEATRYTLNALRELGLTER